MYIVAGILVSNEEICDTVDRIKIAPRVEMKEAAYQYSTKKVHRLEISGKKSAIRKRWYHKLNVFQLLFRIKSSIRLQWQALSIWTIPNFFIERSTNLLCRTFVISSYCDDIYN